VALAATFERKRRPSITAGLCPRPSKCWTHSFGTNGLAVGAPSLAAPPAAGEAGQPVVGAADRRFHPERHEKDH
jgi:hypothetical protein